MTDKRVPREPTPEMLQAGRLRPSFAGDENALLADLWRAMHDAAPAAPDARDEQIARLNGLIEKQIEELVESRAERDALKAALRGVVIQTSEDADWCDLCGKRWCEEGESHRPGCLAAPGDGA